MLMLSETYNIKVSNFLEGVEITGCKELLQLRISQATCFTQRHYKYNLTKRESECLFYVLKGMTAKVIAIRMGISSKTVEKFIQILKEKLGCHCKGRLIEKAIKDGMINVIPVGINISEFG